MATASCVRAHENLDLHSSPVLGRPVHGEGLSPGLNLRHVTIDNGLRLRPAASVEVVSACGLRRETHMLN